MKIIRTHKLVHFALTALFLMVSHQAEASDKSHGVITPGNEKYIAGLLGPYSQGIGLFKVKAIVVESDSVTYNFVSNDTTQFSLILSHPAESKSNERSEHFSITFQGDTHAAGMDAIARTLAQVIRKNDTKDVWSHPVQSAEPAPLSEQTHSSSFNVSLPSYSGEIAAFTFYFLLLLMGFFQRTRNAILDWIYKLEKLCNSWYFLATLLLTGAAAFLRIYSSNLPVFEGGSVERLFFADQPPLQNLLFSQDPRRPGLYFALIHWPLIISNYSVFAVRIVGAIFSIISVPLLGAAVKRVAGALPAILGMSLLSVAPEFIFRSRELTDVGLFVMLGIASILFYMIALSSSKLRDKILLALSLGLTLLSSMAAVFVVAGLGLHAVLNRARIRSLWKTFLAALLIGLPSWGRLLASVPQEMASKRMSSLHPQHFWGAWGFSEFIEWTINTLYTHSLEVSATVGMAATIVLCRSKLKNSSVALCVLLLNLALPLGAFVFRMRPHYAIFIQPAMFLFLTSMLGPLAVEKHEKRSELKDYMGIIIPIAAILVLICSYTGDLKTRSHEIYTQQSERDTGIQQFIEQAKKDGAKTLVQDLSHDKSLAVYYFFDKPFQSMTKYFKSNRGTLELVDIGSDKMVVALVEGSNLYPGWELDSERKLRILLSERPVHFLYVNTFSNEILIKLLYQKCEERMKGSKYILFKCKKEEP